MTRRRLQVPPGTEHGPPPAGGFAKGPGAWTSPGACPCQTQPADPLLPTPKGSQPTHHRARKTPKKVVLCQEVSCRVCRACSWLK